MPRVEPTRPRPWEDYTDRILAISPSGRVTGIAVTQGPTALRRFETIGVRAEHELRDKALAFERRLGLILDAERPGLVLIEAVDGLRRTPLTDALAAAAQRLARERKIPHALFPLADARRLLDGTTPTRVGIHRLLAARFPQIARCTRQRLTSKWYGDTDQYWERPFAALALAVAWSISPEPKSSPTRT